MKNKKSLFDKMKEQFKQGYDKINKKKLYEDSMQEALCADFKSGLEATLQQMFESRYGGFLPTIEEGWGKKRFDILYVGDTNQIVAILPSPSGIAEHWIVKSWIISGKYYLLPSANISEALTAGLWASTELKKKIMGEN